MERDKALAAGDQQTAAAWHAEQQRKQLEVQNWQPDTPSLEQAVRAGDGYADWARAGIGQGVGTTIEPMIGGAAGLAAGLLLRNRLPSLGKVLSPTVTAAGGAAIPAYNMETNEAALTAASDPTVMATTTPQQRIDVNRVKGAINTAGEIAVPAMLTSSLVGAGARKVAGAGGALGVGAGTIGKAVGGEALTEAAQEGVGMAAHSVLNPQRDTSHDAWRLAEAAAQGGMVGGGMAIPSAAVDTALSAAGQVPGVSMPDVKVPSWDSRPRDVTADAVGKGAADLVNHVFGSRNPDLDSLVKPQEKGMDLRADDITRNESATRLSKSIMDDPDAAPELKKAAEAYMQGPKQMDAWKSLAGAAKEQRVASKLSKAVDDFADQVGELGSKAKSLASATKDAYAEGRKKNAQRPEADEFDALLSDQLFPHTGMSNPDQILNKMPDITYAMRTWMEHGFGVRDQEQVNVPNALFDMFDDPAQAVTKAVNLMVREGYADEELIAPKLKIVLSEINARTEATKHEGLLIEEYLKPTAQAKHQFSGADHEELARAIKQQITEGKVNKDAMSALFRDPERLLEALHRQMPKTKGVLQTSDEQVRLSDEERDDGAEQSADRDEMDQLTDAMHPNEVTENVKWHGYNGEKPYATAGVISDKNKAEIGTHDAHATTKAGDLKARNNSEVERKGYIDYLYEKHANDDPEVKHNAVVDFIEQHMSELTADERAAPDKALNKKYFMLRESQRSDRHTGVDISANEFKAISGRGNVWAKKVGKNVEVDGKDMGPEFGGPEHGTLWFERADGKRFAVSAAKIVKRMREAKKGGELGDAVGAKDQLAMLRAGISSFLNSQDATGSFALKGHVGVQENGGVRWLKGTEDLPKTLVLHGSTNEELKAEVAAQRVNELRAELKNYLASDAENDTVRNMAKTALASGEEQALQKVVDNIDSMAGQGNNEQRVRKTKDENGNTRIELRPMNPTAGSIGKRTIKGVNAEGKPAGGRQQHHGISEAEEFSAQAERSEQNKVRTHDEYGNETQPRTKPTHIEHGDQPKQVAWVLDTLRKGVPAFNAALKKMSTEQKASVKALLTQMVETKSPDAPVWSGKPPKNMTEFGKRARLALAQIGEVESAKNFQRTNDAPRATPEELKAANEYLDTALGKKMKRSFEDDLGGHSADWTPDARGNVIRIATNAVGGVLTNAYHESMHEFFHRLVTGKQEDVTKLLRTVADNAIVTRSLERILQDHPDALRSLADPEERLAYAYQFWAAGHPLLKIGTQAQGFFGKVAKFLRNITGLLSNDEKVEALFRQFKEGKLQKASAAGEVIAELNNNEQRVQAVVAKMEPLRRATIDLVGSAEDNLLKSSNPSLQRIGKSFADHTNGFIQAHDRAEKQWLGKLKGVLKNHDKDDVAAALEGLQTGKLSHDAKIRAVQEDARKLLDEMHPYLTEAGVSVMNQTTGEWELVGKLKNYFPRSWNMDMLYDKSADFIALLIEHHSKELESIATLANAEVARGVSAGKRSASATIKDRPITAEDIAHSIYHRLMGSNGQNDLSEDSFSLGFSPMMKAVNRRTLDWIDMTKFHEFQNKDLVNIMSSYIMQGTKRAEYTRRFGPDGHLLQEQMDTALDFETERLMAKDTTLTKAEAEIEALKVLAPARRAVMAMEGTLGHDINPTLRKAQGWVLAYQNWRMLPMALFSNLIDPLGIMVRGGTMNDVFTAYKSGLQDVVNSWRGKDREDNLTQMGELIGTLDAHGYMNSMGTMMNSIYMSGGAKHINDTLFRINGMEALNRSLRGSATQAAIGFIKRHATQPNGHSERLLAELGLDAAYVKSKLGDTKVEAADGLDVTDPRIQNAVAQWVNEAILRPNSAQRPSRGSDPHYALIMHFKGFMYSMYKQILGRAASEARLGNYTAASTLALGYVPIMFMADMTKLIVQNAVAGNADMPGWWTGMDAKDHFLYAAERAGLAGPLQIAGDAANYGPIAAAGPTAEQLAGLFTDPLGTSAGKALPWSQFFASAQRAVNE
jgi:hypothetical protein